MVSEKHITRHGCAVVLGRTGLFVTGPSGSGKTRLCMLLIDRWRSNQLYARWVADDRLFLDRAGHSILARAPAALEGLAERRFQGIEKVASQPKAIIDVAVKLESVEVLERCPSPGCFALSEHGPRIPQLTLPAGNPIDAAELVVAHLTSKLPTECH